MPQEATETTCTPQAEAPRSPLQDMRKELSPNGGPSKTIPVVHAKDITPEEFYEQYIVACTPVVIEGVMEGGGDPPQILAPLSLSTVSP